MGWWFWKKTSQQAEAFAVELGTHFFSKVSPDRLSEYFRGGDGNKKARKGVETEIHDLTLRLNQFKNLHKLGVYGKAKFHQAFMARLEELGYDQQAVKELNNVLLIKTP
jgi:hypothetical protein